MKNSYHRYLVPVAMLFALAIGNLTRAELLVYEPFDIQGTTPVGAGSGIGWSGNWELGVAGNIGLTDQRTFGSLSTSGRGASLVGPYGSQSNHHVLRTMEFDDSSIDGEIWISFLYQAGWCRPEGCPEAPFRFGFTEAGGIEIVPTGSEQDEARQVNTYIHPKARTQESFGAEIASEISVGGTSFQTEEMGSSEDRSVYLMNDGELYLILSRITGSGTSNQTLTVWALSESNFGTFVNSGWDVSILDNAANHRQRIEVTNAGATADPIIEGTGYKLRIGYREAMESYMDEIRIGTTAMSVAPSNAVEAPSITTHPASQEIDEREPVTFSVVADGTLLQYQWQFNEADISGATDATYTINSVQLSDAGQYRVVVTNPGGTAISDAATLTVAASAIVITEHPQSQSVLTGDTVAFSVTIDGDPVTYQWQFNGTDIDGATDATYTIDNVALADAGSYQVVLTRDTATTTSDPANLTVIQRLEFVEQPTDLTVTYGQQMQVFGNAQGKVDVPLQYRFYQNDEAVTGFRQPTYTIGSVDFSHAGEWKIEVRENDEERRNLFSDPFTVTIVAPHGLPHSLAAATSGDGNHFVSSWLGGFYFHTDFGNWIYSEDHGWIYVWPEQDVGTLWYWDLIAADYFYTEAEHANQDFVYIYWSGRGWTVFDRINSTIGSRLFWVIDEAQWVVISDSE